MISSWKLKQESVTSFCTEVLGVTSTFNHLNGWCPSLSLVSTFDFAGVFCIDLAVVGVTLMDCFLSSAIGSAGVFLPCWVNRLIWDSSEWTKADTHSFSDWGKRGWRAWKLLVLYWPDVQGLSPLRSVMGSLLHRCTFMWLQFILFHSLSPPISPAYLLLVHCVLCMDALASTPTPTTPIYTLTWVITSFVNVCNLLNATFS